MKKCPHCGAEIPESSNFCLYCMTSLNKKDTLTKNVPANKRRYIILLFLIVLTQILKAGRFVSASPLSIFFINHKFWVFAVFFVGANEKEIHITGNSEATVSAKLTFKLIS